MPSHDPNSTDTSAALLRAEAARWVVLRDRGFAQNEAVEFQRWLAADPRRAASIDDASAVWAALDAIPIRIGQPIVDKTVRGSIWHWPAVGGLAVAAALALCFVDGWQPDLFFPRSGEPPASDGRTALAALQTKVLGDGTRVRLNVGAEMIEDFSAHERRVRLVRGEAYFIVTRDPARPFVVQAGEITVRAVGTAFNVRWQPRAVDVLVTEGKVEVNSRQNGRNPNSPVPKVPLIVAGQRAVVSIAAAADHPPVVVSEVNQADMARALAWHEPLRRLTGATLIELAVDFERQTGRRLVVADPALGKLQVGGRFRSDDLEGLLRLLEENYGIRSERAADGAVVLRAVTPGP